MPWTPDDGCELGWVNVQPARWRLPVCRQLDAEALLNEVAALLRLVVAAHDLCRARGGVGGEVSNEGFPLGTTFTSLGLDVVESASFQN
jgi:hypothetical protein